MALKYGFYDSRSGDREYSSQDLTRIFNNLIMDGVLPRTVSTNQFAATPAASGLGVKIDTGWAWFNSTYTHLTSAQTFTLDAADAVLYRWDAIVIETDSENRENSIKVVKGTPAAEGAFVKPTLTANQHPLCYAKVTPGLTSMIQGNIENRVGFSDCPFIVGAVGSANLTQVFAQWEYDFDTWFDGVVNTLSGDVAGNLLALIQQNQAAIGEINTKLKSKLEQADLAGLVKMMEVSGTITTLIGSGSRLQEVILNNSVTIPLPTDAIAFVFLSASVSGSYTSTAGERNDTVLIDMTSKRRMVDGGRKERMNSVYNTAEQPDVITVGDGEITISGTLFRDTWTSAGDSVRYSNNTPLTYYVKYLTKVTQ